MSIESLGYCHETSQKRLPSGVLVTHATGRRGGYSGGRPSDGVHIKLAYSWYPDPTHGALILSASPGNG